MTKHITCTGADTGGGGGGEGGGRTRRPPPPKIEINLIFWRKIEIFHMKYLKNVRATLRSAQFF